MAITNAELFALDFGYLTGADLSDYASLTLLISQYAKNPDSFQRGCTNAQALMVGNADTKYDMAGEYAKTGADRSALCTQITAILACRNIVGNLVNDGDMLREWFKWADKQVLAARNGQLNLPLKLPAIQPDGSTPYSDTRTVCSSFRTLG